MRGAYARALNRLAEEMDAVVAAIPEAEEDALLALIARLEELDKAYAWITDHIPSGSSI